jgi:hypothetical protein
MILYRFIPAMIIANLIGCTADNLKTMTTLDGTWSGKGYDDLVVANGKLTHVGSVAICEGGELRYMRKNIYSYDNDKANQDDAEANCRLSHLTIILSNSGNHIAVAEDYSGSGFGLLEKNFQVAAEEFDKIDLAYNWRGAAAFVNGNITAEVNGTSGTNSAIIYSEERRVLCDETSCTTILFGLARSDYDIDDDINRATPYSGEVTFNTDIDISDGVWGGVFTTDSDTFGLSSDSSATVVMSQDKTFTAFRICHVATDANAENSCSPSIDELTGLEVCLENADQSEPLNFGCDIVAGERI